MQWHVKAPSYLSLIVSHRSLMFSLNRAKEPPACDRCSDTGGGGKADRKTISASQR